MALVQFFFFFLRGNELLEELLIIQGSFSQFLLFSCGGHKILSFYSLDQLELSHPYSKPY